VAEVVNPMSCSHPGMGRKKISPTTKTSTVLTQGASRGFIRASADDTFPSRAIA
jgi:hypothetical protein